MSLVLMIQRHDAVFIGADSKTVSIGSEVATVSAKPKIRQANGVVFANIGLFRDSHGKMDVEREASIAAAAGGDLDEIADRFATAIQEQLLAALSDIREQNAEYFHENLHRPLEILFTSVRDGKAQAIVSLFEVIDMAAAKLAFQVTHMKAPEGIATVGLGVHDAADQWIDDHKVMAWTNPITAIREAIMYQESVTPEFVSLPISAVSIDHLGVHECS